MSFYAYMLRCADGSYYAGHTDDLDARMAAHQSGLMPGYTSKRIPVQLAWSQEFAERDHAFAAERQIKGWSRPKKEALIRGDWEAIQLLSRKLFLRPSFDTPLSAATQDERFAGNPEPLILSSGPSEAKAAYRRTSGMSEFNEATLLEACVLAAREAGAEILKLVAAGFEVETKSDQSPVTVCDRAAEAIILSALAKAAPGVPVIAEEEVAAGRIPAHGDIYFLVDPLDGTKEFVRGGDDYTVNIGLIVGATPRLGVVYQPALDRLHLGLVGAGAWLEQNGGRTAIATRPLGKTRDAVASKSHFNQATADYLDQAIGACEYVAVGSSLKFCLVAEGRADIYPRLSPTSEWDTAAGHAVLLAAGGRVDGPDAAPLAYGKTAFLNRGFCATAGWPAPAIAPFLTEFGGGGDLPQGV